MTPRERWLAVLSGQKPDRVPCDFWGTAEITARLATVTYRDTHSIGDA